MLEAFFIQIQVSWEQLHQNNLPQAVNEGRLPIYTAPKEMQGLCIIPQSVLNKSKGLVLSWTHGPLLRSFGCCTTPYIKKKVIAEAALSKQRSSCCPGGADHSPSWRKLHFTWPLVSETFKHPQAPSPCEKRAFVI